MFCRRIGLSHPCTFTDEMTTVPSPYRWMECKFAVLEELNAHDTFDEVLPTIVRETLVAFMYTGVVREWTPSSRSTMTHIPGHWPEERSSRMSSRDWQGGSEATDPHAAVACRDTHESCVVTGMAAARTRINHIGTSKAMSVFNSYRFKLNTIIII